MTSWLTKFFLSFVVFCNIVTHLGFFRSLYWFYWTCKQAILTWISWPQPHVTRFGKYYVVHFTVKNNRCKLICSESPYIIDIMENTDSSVKDQLQPFFQMIPLNLYQNSEGKELLVSTLGCPEMQIAHLPSQILKL